MSHSASLGPIGEICECTHRAARHADSRHYCMAEHCECSSYRPIVPANAKPELRLAPSPQPDFAYQTVAKVLAEAKQCGVPRISAAADKLLTAVYELQARMNSAALRESARRNAAQKRVNELEAQLARARRALNLGVEAAPRKPVVDLQLRCQHGCKETFKTAGGRGSHHQRKHGVAGKAS